VSTGFTLNAFVGVFVTRTPVPILTVVLSPLPQAAIASELTATRTMPYVTLRDLIRDICCSCHS
jgi:hypothetical protein